MRHISVHNLKEALDTRASKPSVDFINVCTPAEYKEKHIEGVRNVPLGELSKRVNEFADKQIVYIHCRSGDRSVRAIETLQSLGVSAELINVEGGLGAWDDAQLPTQSHTRRLPIMRQVFLAAGALTLLGLALGSYSNPVYYLLSAVVGLGLVFSGLSGWCGMAFILAKMAWNK